MDGTAQGVLVSGAVALVAEITLRLTGNGGVAVLVSSRLLLGLCALVLAWAALRGEYDSADRIGDLEAELVCREAYDAALDGEFATALDEHRAGVRSLARGRGDIAGEAMNRTPDEVATFDDVAHDRASAVALCAGAG